LEIINQLVQEYAENFSSPLCSLSGEIEVYTQKNHPKAHMLSGHLQGKLLEMISWMIRPRRILEIGTFTGFSALCLAKGLLDDGILHTIELREEDADKARAFFSESSFAKRIISHTGNALTIIPELNETWDLVFIDAEKQAYIDYFNLVFPRVRKNGFILADNIFFHGKIFEQEGNKYKEDSGRQNKNVKAIKDFNEFINTRTDIEKVILTIRDGLYLVRKL
jgi:predicted O-methyltransferase YrrM